MTWCNKTTQACADLVASVHKGCIYTVHVAMMSILCQVQQNSWIIFPYPLLDWFTWFKFHVRMTSVAMQLTVTWFKLMHMYMHCTCCGSLSISYSTVVICAGNISVLALSKITHHHCSNSYYQWSQVNNSIQYMHAHLKPQVIHNFNCPYPDPPPPTWPWDTK